MKTKSKGSTKQMSNKLTKAPALSPAVSGGKLVGAFTGIEPTNLPFQDGANVALLIAREPSENCSLDNATVLLPSLVEAGLDVSAGVFAMAPGAGNRTVTEKELVDGGMPGNIAINLFVQGRKNPHNLGIIIHRLVQGQSWEWTAKQLKDEPW